jgi:hypothetical protein
MSTQLNHYVLFGQRFAFDELETLIPSENQEPYFDSAFEGVHHRDGLCIVSDGMNCEYAFVGRVLAKTNDHEGLEEPVEVALTQPLIEEVAGAITKLLGVSEPRLGTFVVSHYR